MIYGTKRDYKRYVSIHPELSLVFDLVMNTDWRNIDDGRYTIDGADAYINYGRNELREDETVFEAHQKYIDLQFIVAGEEEIRCCPQQNAALLAVYDEEKDRCLLKSDEYSTIVLHENEWVLLFPEDAHAALIKHSVTSDLKVVAKIGIK